jgi:YD repeat-containing protein
VIASLGCSWWIDLLTNNCVAVVTGGGSELFVLQPTSGQASTIVYPQGVTITFNYTDGVLTSVTNGLGRTLTFTYTGANLTGVSDDSRTVSYAYDSTGNLTQFTDADDNVTTYSYVSAGLLYQTFLPANPTVAVQTITYDTLNRVETIQDALGGSVAKKWQSTSFEQWDSCP